MFSKALSFDQSKFIRAGLNSGSEVSHSSRELFRKIMVGISILAFITHTLFFAIFIYFNVRLLAVFNLGSMVCYGAAYLLCMQRRPMQAWFIVMAEVIAHAVLATIILGWGTGFHLLMILVIPVLCFGYQPLYSQKVPIAAIVVGLYIWLDIHYRVADPVAVLPVNIAEAMHVTNVFIFLFFLGFLCALYEYIVRLSEQKLSEYATTDTLTQLKNRRAIMACAEIELARQRRNDEPITLALCDIDHFKRINDTFGHDAGDRIIKSVADVLRNSTRTTDHVGRWGGEEFIIILPETPIDRARIVMERIRRQVEETVFLGANNAGIDLNCTPVTMTFGVIEQKSGDALVSIDQIIDKADKNLYQGKRDGRNRVIG